MSFVYDCTDFKRYLFENNNKIRVEGLSVWINTIPIPVDIFNQLFDLSEDFFELYLDHLLAVILVANAIENGQLKGVSLDDLPDSKLVQSNLELIESAILSELNSCRFEYSRFVDEMCKVLGLDSYSIQVDKLIKALSHKGKKYKRIYCPNYIKKRVKECYPNVLNSFSISNWDMFGNVIADSMGIYRIGFSDALAIIFSRLLDFKINECSGFVSKQSKITLEALSVAKEQGSRVVIERTTDGALWEPLYDGEHKVRVNSSHPYFKTLMKEGADQSGFFDLVLKLAEYEDQAVNDNLLKNIEGMRSAISRVLWLETDAV